MKHLQEDRVSRASLIVLRRGRFVIENGVIRNITSRDTIRDTVSIAGDGDQGLFVRHIVVENIRAYNSELRGAVETSDGTEHITIRDVYAESCLYGVDVQDHNGPGQINRFINIENLTVKNSRFAVRTANHDFGHDGLTIRNVTGTDWPADAKEPFQVRNTSNVLIDNVRLYDCPVAPCMRIRGSNNVTLRDISFVDYDHDDPALQIEDGNNVVTDSVETIPKGP